MTDRAPLTRVGILLPLGLFIVTTIYLAASFDIRTQFTGDGEMSPRSMPILTALMMYAALAVVLVKELRQPTSDAPHGNLLRPALVIAATIGYIALFRPLGYVLATLAYSAALFVIFDYQTRRPLMFALAAIGVTAVFYGLFAGIFGVRLPTLLTEGFL